MGINAVLLVMAFLLIGNEFGVKTVYTAMILGPLTQLCDKLYPYVNLTHKVVDNPEVLAQLQAGIAVSDANGIFDPHPPRPLRDKTGLWAFGPYPAA